MQVLDLFWSFFILSGLVQRSHPEAMRTRKIAQVEKRRGGRLIRHVRIQETAEMPDAFRERTTLCPRPVGRGGGVGYLPAPRRCQAPAQ